MVNKPGSTTALHAVNEPVNQVAQRHIKAPIPNECFVYVGKDDKRVFENFTNLKQHEAEMLEGFFFKTSVS